MGPRKQSRTLEPQILESTFIVKGIFGSKNLRNCSSEMIFQKHNTRKFILIKYKHLWRHHIYYMFEELCHSIKHNSEPHFSETESLTVLRVIWAIEAVVKLFLLSRVIIPSRWNQSREVETMVLKFLITAGPNLEHRDSRTSRLHGNYCSQLYSNAPKRNPRIVFRVIREVLAFYGKHIVIAVLERARHRILS
jgi:hypothetical protein